MVHTEIRPIIKISNVNKITHWCIKKIGPRLFYMHNKIGGSGWILKKVKSDWYLELEDPKKMTMLILSIGDAL